MEQKFILGKAPCKNCEDRNEDCHGDCEKYLEWKKYRDSLKEDPLKYYIYMKSFADTGKRKVKK